MLFTVAAALVTSLVGWVGGLGGNYSEPGWDGAKGAGILCTFLLSPLLLTRTTQARRLGIPYAWRAAGWLLFLITLLLPAVLRSNTFITAPGYDVFGCGVLLDRDSYVNVDDDQRTVCDPIRARRLAEARFLALLGVGAAAALAYTTLLPGQPSLETASRKRQPGPFG